jgi:thiosulfate/3-mercaptopyruvate sulfurtransferase
MKRIAPLLLAAALAACTAAPAPEAAPEPKAHEEMRVSAAELAKLLDHKDVVVLHVGRDRASYDAGHVPGARYLPLGAIVVEENGIPNELPPVAQLDSVFESVGVSDDSRVVLYGDLGGLAAARACFTLDYLGHARVGLLDGGLDVWKAEGHPVSTEASATVARGSFTPRPQGERVVTAGWVNAHLKDPKVVLIDARPPAEYSGAEAGGGVDRPGHIPGARNLFWRTLLASDQDPQLRSHDVLRGLFEGAGAEMGKTIVTYCRTGVQASFDYYVARYLGYDDVKMYDGSFIDWSRRNELPVER